MLSESTLHSLVLGTYVYFDSSEDATTLTEAYFDAALIAFFDHSPVFR